MWREVSTLLAHPERLAEEYRRRLHPESSTKSPALATVETHLGKLRQGLARLIDSYADGLIDKQEFEPRILRLRRRIAQAEEQRQQLVDAATLQTELPLIIGRLEDFATQVHHGLAEADWERKRDLIRALVKRVEVAQDDVNIVFRIDPYPSDADPEKKSLQDCRRSDYTALWSSSIRTEELPVLYISSLEHLLKEAYEPLIIDAFFQKFNHKVVINIIKETRYINVTDPFGPVPSVLDN
jgi:site-specific DNA recombinase